MIEFIKTLISGLGLGSIYALIALGYTMVYGIAKMLNFAHGDVIMVGAYVCFFAVTRFSLPPIVGILFAMVVCTLLGMLIERLAYKPRFVRFLDYAVILVPAPVLVNGEELSRLFRGLLHKI